MLWNCKRNSKASWLHYAYVCVGTYSTTIQSWPLKTNHPLKPLKHSAPLDCTAHTNTINTAGNCLAAKLHLTCTWLLNTCSTGTARKPSKQSSNLLFWQIFPKHICSGLYALPVRGVWGCGGVLEACVRGEPSPPIPWIIANKNVRLFCGYALCIVPPAWHDVTQSVMVQ